MSATDTPNGGLVLRGPSPEEPTCITCAGFIRQILRAEKAGNKSGASDARVLLRRHAEAAHGDVVADPD